jgi:hypothetical protein
LQRERFSRTVIGAMSYTINGRRVVNSFGGVKNLWKKLLFHGVLVQPRTLAKWIEKGKIPLDKFCALVSIAHKEGWSLRLEDMCPRLKTELQQNDTETNTLRDIEAERQNRLT